MIFLKNIKQEYKIGSEVVSVLRGLNCEIKRGEFVAIMGPSGSGKSTFLNIIGCLHKPSEGSYILDNVVVDLLVENQLAMIRSKKIGFVFQSFNLFPRLTVFRNVELALIYGACPKKERIGRVQKILEDVGLSDRINHTPSELSGGEQQRTAIARALITNPDIILADEPTGNLDSVSGAEIMEIFLRMKEKGSTIIMATHDDDKAQYASRILKLKDGNIVSDVLSF